MKNETQVPLPCDAVPRGCWIGQHRVIKPLIFWPLKVAGERDERGRARWYFYIKWENGTRTHVNDVPLCEQHHRFFLDMFSIEARLDRVEQEQTDAWMIRNGGRL